MADLLINGQDALATWGVRMGSGFLDVLGEPAPLKAYVTNDDYLTPGVAYCDAVPVPDERQLTLSFTLEGSDTADFLSKRGAFYALLYAGDLAIQVPPYSAEVFRLKYTGKSVSYAQDTSRTFCRLSVKFLEPDPTAREALEGESRPKGAPNHTAVCRATPTLSGAPPSLVT